MRKINKQLLSLIVGFAFIPNALPVTTVFAAEESVLQEEALHTFGDIYGTGVYGLELFYGPDYGTSLPEFHGVDDIDFETLPNYDASFVDSTNTTYEVVGYLAESPYDGVAFDAEAVWEKDWVPQDILEIEHKPGHYQIIYTYYDSSGNQVGGDRVIVSFIDNTAPVIDYNKDINGNPKPATVLLGSEVSYSDIVSQWGLTITDNRLGNIEVENTFNLDDIVESGTYSVLGLHSITIPSEGWITDFQTNNPVDAANFATTNLWINVVENKYAIDADPVTVWQGEEYFFDMHNINAYNKLTMEPVGVDTLLSDESIGEGYQYKPGLYTVTFIIQDGETSFSKSVTLTVLPLPVVEAKNIEVMVGDTFDLDLFEATAKDFDDTALPANLVSITAPVDITGKYTTSGIYEAVFETTNEAGKTGTKTVEIKVNNPIMDEPEITEYYIEAYPVEIWEGEEYSYEMHSPLGVNETKHEPVEVEVVPNSKNPVPGEYNLPGVYTVTFGIKDSNGEFIKTVETTLTVLGFPNISGNNITVYKGESFNLNKFGIIAFDPEDGYLEFEYDTENIPLDEKGNYTTPGTYLLNLKVTDSTGMSKMIAVEVLVLDNPEKEPVTDFPPVIKGKDLTMTVGEFWDITMHELDIADKEDESVYYEITKNTLPLSMGNQILLPGDYEITIKARDSKGQETIKTFKIHVNKQVDPEYSDTNNTGIDKNNSTTGSQNEESQNEDSQTITQFGNPIDFNILLGISILLVLAGTSLLIENKKKN